MAPACGRWRDTCVNYPLREFVTHRFPLRDVEAAVHKSSRAGFHESCHHAVGLSTECNDREGDRVPSNIAKNR